MLAWALARNGRCGEALRYSQRALRLGTQDALKLLPPRDDRALPRPPADGDALARAARCALNPHFSLLWAPVATEGAAMKRLVVLLLALAPRSLAPAAAAAHPLGNFTVNRFSRVEVSGHRLYVLYVLDMAEIPTFQAGRIDARSVRTRGSRANAHLDGRRDGRRALVAGRARALAHPRGRGRPRHDAARGRARRPAARRAEPRSRTATRTTRDRIGWKEIVVGADTPSRSDELRAYPKDLLAEPARRDVGHRRARARATGPTSRPRSRADASLQAPDRVADSGFAALVGRSHLSLLVILASLAAALFWGAAHALSPGHGKTIVTAYLVGQRGTPRHAALLGLIVTITHTIGVFTLGLVTLALSQFIVPDRLYPWLNLVSGLLVVGDRRVGLLLALAAPPRARPRPPPPSPPPRPSRTPSFRSLLAVGVSGGLLPCPSALVVLLAAISLHRVAFGLLLIVAFSAGLALTITGIGLAAVLARARVSPRRASRAALVRLLPAASALVILVAGLAMTVRAVPKVS